MKESKIDQAYYNIKNHLRKPSSRSIIIKLLEVKAAENIIELDDVKNRWMEYIGELYGNSNHSERPIPANAVTEESTIHESETEIAIERL